MRLVPIAVLLLLLPPAARAQEAPEIRVGYAAYAAGLNVLAMQAAFRIAPDSYRVRLVLDTTGMFGMVVHSHSDSVAQGSFTNGAGGPRVLPQRFYSWGDTRGTRRITQIDYPDGQPKLVQLVPPAGADDHDPVPPAQIAGTIDSLSAMALLIHMVAQTGACDGTVRMFDGRRLSELSAHTAGHEVLEATDRSSFSGPALRCDVEGRQLAGFVHDAPEAELKRVQHGTAWMAPLRAGGAAVPVRIAFQTRWFGQATMYVTAPGTMPVAAGPG